MSHSEMKILAKPATTRHSKRIKKIYKNRSPSISYKGVSSKESIHDSDIVNCNRTRLEKAQNGE